jgi:hypothetical protein
MSFSTTQKVLLNSLVIVDDTWVIVIIYQPFHCDYGTFLSSAVL